MVDVIDKMFGVSSGGNEDEGKMEDRKTAGFSQLSNNIVDIMSYIAQNEGIRSLLYVDTPTPFAEPSKNTPQNKKEDAVPDKREILSPASEKNRIKPVSFDTDATTSDKTEIRVYYNVGRVDGSGKQIDANIHIDIICAKNLWMIKDAIGRSKIRPYEIMSRIADEIGANNRNKINLGRITQFQMLSVNDQFDSIRIYYNTRDIAGDIRHVKD